MKGLHDSLIRHQVSVDTFKKIKLSQKQKQKGFNSYKNNCETLGETSSDP